MTGRVVVVVDPYSSGNLLPPALRELGLVPVAVTSSPAPPEVYQDSYQPADFTEIIPYEGRLAETVARLRAYAPVCVVPGAESGVELADQLAAAVTPALANDAALAPARRHKGLMTEAVARHGLPVGRQICAADPTRVAAWVAQNQLADVDLVVKPAKSAGTDGVTRVGPGGDWRAVMTSLLGRRNRMGQVNDEVVVQEFLHGTEYVVDTFTFDGVHSVSDICRYRKTDNGPNMAVYDSMDWMPYDTARYGDLLTYATGVLDALGVRFGPAHTEVMMTSRGPRLIEANMRIHGGGQPRFCRVATGDSQLDRLVRYCAGQRDIPPDYELREAMRVVFLISPRSGVLRNAEIYQRILTLPSCYHATISLRDGDRVEATHDLFSSLALGFVVLVHERPEQVRADYEAIREIEAELKIDPVDTGVLPAAT